MAGVGRKRVALIMFIGSTMSLPTGKVLGYTSHLSSFVSILRACKYLFMIILECSFDFLNDLTGLVEK